MKKNGFISMTLVYTFLILFMFLMLAILRTYTEKDKYLQAINEQIDNDIGVAKGSRVTVTNRLLEDNMPNDDGTIRYFKVANSKYGNGNTFYYMVKRNFNLDKMDQNRKSYYGAYKFEDSTDENGDGHTSRIYYFRGNVDNNFLVFANMCFRIIRTNEDGSIRVVYFGPRTGTASNPTCKDMNDNSFNFNTLSIGNAAFNTNNSVEYVKTTNGVLPSADESNEQSPIIEILNQWYREKFMVNDSNTINYTEYISKETVFCNNKSSYFSGGYYQSRELSPVFIDLTDKNVYNDDNVLNLISFKCANAGDRFVIKEGTLLYPIGLLTAQDVVLAGGYLDIDAGKSRDDTQEDEYDGGSNNTIVNEDFYLYSDKPYWTMTPLSNQPSVIYLGSEGILKGDNPSAVHAIRPVISLNADIVISRGNGRAGSPYVVKTTAN